MTLYGRPVSGSPSAAARARTAAQGGHVPVRVDLAARPREPHAVDDRGVVEGVRDEQVRLAGNDGQDAGVGREARLEDEGSLDALEGGQVVLELFVEGHRAGDRPHGS